MTRTKDNVPRGSEGGDELAAAPTPAPYLNSGSFGGAPGGSWGPGGSAEAPIIKKEQEEEETLGQLRDRLGPGLRRVPGPRAIFVHIKVEDSTSGEETDGEGDGDGEEATGGEGDGERWDEEEEDEEEAEDGRQQREQQMQSPGANFEGRIVSGAGAVALPRRARLPPGSYADTAVEPDTEDDFEEEEEEEEWGADEKEEEAEPRDERTHVPGAKLKGGSQAVCPPSLRPKERSAPGPGSQRGQLLRAPGRVADNTV